ncbi:ribonuclease HII [Nitrosospira sp. NpAV]|uniref:ribonuclease HII n=1 Tax=Nitrosospira sp. NpAV TaxID=58133 RepID=UPI0005A25E6B|nr:ribonuclease HII [Nitrosospira sp. NpAV]KIO50227.1 ribonuclease HII [Nitrosospira sp. NpAV]
MVEGINWVCGVDEAGRGPLAGPVFAACVVLGPDHGIEGLADSKTLSEAQRNRLTIAIKAYSVAWAIGSASVKEIDRLNILQASLLAMKRAVESLSIIPGRVLVDGNHSPRLRWPVTTIVGGDSLIPEISAASILAKTARDAEMVALHQRFPHYGFDRHKGYSTTEHIAALRVHGASVIHRRHFAPVRELIINGKAQVAKI